MSSKNLPRTLRMAWIDEYIRYPDIIAHEAGKNFMGAAFKANANMVHIPTKSIPVESSNSLTYVERYHSPTRRALNIIQRASSNLKEECGLQVAVKAINDSVRSDGLVTTLLVFGTSPRLGIPTDGPIHSIFFTCTCPAKG